MRYATIRNFLVTLALTGSMDIHAEDKSQFSQLNSQLSKGAVLEGAESHGSLGLKFGVGLQSISVEENSEISYHYRLSDTEGRGTLTVPSIGLVKGLGGPFDFIFIHSFLESRRISQGGAFLQWTIFEAFSWPAIALRTGVHRLWGLEQASFSGMSVEGVLSYGFRYLSLYLSQGMSQNNQAKYSQYDLVAINGSKQKEKQTVYVPNQSFGVRIVILPPFLTAAFEALQGNQGINHLAFKISAGH